MVLLARGWVYLLTQDVCTRFRMIGQLGSRMDKSEQQIATESAEEEFRKGCEVAGCNSFMSYSISIKRTLGIRSSPTTVGGESGEDHLELNEAAGGVLQQRLPALDGRSDQEQE